MGQLIFNEESMINGNIFKFEQRLQSHVNKYIENGAILTEYYSQRENATTVDRGTKTIDELFGSHSPLRFNKIENFPLYGFNQTNPENTDENQIEDINVEGDCIILPSTIVPKPMDFFKINHLKMNAIFEVTSVIYDSMKVEGYYKIHYRLQSTSDETISNLLKQTVETYHTDLNAIGSDINPIIQKDDFVLRSDIHQMINTMIKSYRSLFYNEKHNCFLYHDRQTGYDYFDLCGNEFMAKHGIMNYENSSNVIMLHNKVNERQLSYFYNNSIYNWLEIGAPQKLIQKFYYILNFASGYPDSSFTRWGDGDDIQVIQPIALHDVGILNQDHTFFDDIQFQSFLDKDHEPSASEFDKLIWKFIHKSNSLNINDISLNTADVLLSSVKEIDVFLYTPIIIYIIRHILSMN